MATKMHIIAACSIGTQSLENVLSNFDLNGTVQQSHRWHWSIVDAWQVS
jgi:hypothetical protein